MLGLKKCEAVSVPGMQPLPSLMQAEAQQEAWRVAAEAFYCGGREECLALAKELAGICGIPPEAAYSALVLLDHCLATGMRFHMVNPFIPQPQLLIPHQKQGIPSQSSKWIC